MIGKRVKSIPRITISNSLLSKKKRTGCNSLVFYSDKHQSIFTHDTTNIHVHVLEKKSGTVGYLDNIQIDDLISIYLLEV